MALGELGTTLLAEFLGTFLFTVTIPLASIGVGNLAPLPIGFMFAAMVFCFGYVSGGHFNPAMTFATLMIREKSITTTLQYIATQLVASLAAILYGSIIVGTNFPAPNPSNSLLTVWQTLCNEAIYTFALASVFLHSTCSRQKSNNFYGFAIGTCLMSASFAVGGYDAGAFNPASVTASQLWQCILNKNCLPLAFVWLFWLAPMLGAFAAAMLFNILDTKPVAPPEDVNRLPGADFR